MTDAAFTDGVGWDILAIVLVSFVLLGAIPAFIMTAQFLIVPWHAVFNHDSRAEPFYPRVAVIIPAWNEGAVIGASVDRLMSLEYPPDRLRIVVVDDASTDDTPTVVQAKARQYPGAVVHLRREQGGQGKAHTLNHGIAWVLESDWMEALLIMDADVIYEPDSLRKMTRHLADPEVGAVTAYIREGSREKRTLTRFISFEYVLAQLGSRRAQNVLGAVACLAGGAQLHSRANIVELGGAIDTSSLAEDTVTTFETQLQGRRVVFEPRAVVLAEEPERIGALWKQRLRWARGNVQLTKRYRHLWFRRDRGGRLGSISFGLMWFSVFLLPVFMILASIGLIGLYLLASPLASIVFGLTWLVVGTGYVYTMVLAAELDTRVARQSWLEVLFFPGAISLLVMLSAFFPGLVTERLPALIGWTMPDWLIVSWTLFSYAWISLCMVAAWVVKVIDSVPVLRWLTPVLLFVVGYGPMLCAITFDAYIKEARGASMAWDKTEKSGRVLG